MIVVKKTGCEDKVFATTSKMFKEFPDLEKHKHNIYKYFSKLKKPYIFGELQIIKTDTKWRER